MQTRASLLVRIRDPKDGLAWSEFVCLYTPLLHSYGMKNGLQDADAADLAQDTLRLVFRAAPGFVYDPGKGSFHGWLFTIARNGIRKFVTRRSHTARGTGDSEVRDLLEAQPNPEPDEDEWNREVQLNLFHWAAKRVQVEFRDKTWQAFWRTVVQNEEIDTVAQDLGLTTGALYIARSRVTARIRQEIQAAIGE
jgi:RNA polymerase sigma-70 factor (ECF subfamily)